MIICLKIFILIVFVTFVQCKMFHEYLTPREKIALFQTTNKVPEYEVVPVIHGIQKRSLKKFFSSIFLKVFGSDLQLYLEPTDGILAGNQTKIWIAVPDELIPNRTKYELVSNVMNTNVKTYHDLLNMAAVTIDRDDSGNLLVDGTIGSNLVMRPVPSRLHKYVSRITRKKRDSILSLKKLEKIASDLKHIIPHIIFKKPNVKENKGLVKPYTDFKDFLNDRIHRFLPAKGGKIYPEVMVFMDRPLFSSFEYDIEAAKKYILSFWNGVDLRYRLLRDPTVRLNIAGIILSAGKTEVPFLRNNYVESDMIDADQALIDIGQSLYNEMTFIHQQDYDLFITMTKLDLCNFNEPSYCDEEALGYAYTSTACFVNETTKMVEAVGIIEDNGGFKGIVPCAHEVGHLLGVNHDEPDNSEERCEIMDGYIMAGGFMMAENGFEWSPCSQKNFSLFLKGSEAKCLKNKPKVPNLLPRVLPGVYYTLEEQCQKFKEGSYPCQVDEIVCMQLTCYDPASGYCESVAPAAEGSACGEDLICINGKCISRLSTKVPRSYNKTFLKQYDYTIKDIVPKIKPYLPKLPFL